MPAPGTICPTMRRERMLFESDEDYAARMKRLDEMRSFFDSIAPRNPDRQKDPADEQ